MFFGHRAAAAFFHNLLVLRQVGVELIAQRVELAGTDGLNLVNRYRTFVARAMKDTVNRATSLWEDPTAKRELVAKLGTAMVNIIHSTKVLARCWSHAPRLMKNAGMVLEC